MSTLTVAASLSSVKAFPVKNNQKHSTREHVYRPIVFLSFYMNQYQKTKYNLYSMCEANRKNDLILTMTPEKQDKTLELSKHWSADSTLARNEVIMKGTYPVKSVKCVKICSNY